MRLPLFSILISGLFALTACSSYAPPNQLVGVTQDQLLARMGPAQTQRKLDDGTTRFEYPTGPYGLHTWFVDVDASGKVLRSEQVLTERHFNQILPDMAQDEVRKRLGRPNSVFLLGRSRGEVWNYRFEGPFCQWFQVEITTEKRVRSAGYGHPPECERGERIIFP